MAEDSGSNLNLTNLTFLAIVGALVGFWGQFKSICEGLASIFVGTVSLRNRASLAADYYLFHRAKLLLRAGTSYDAMESRVKNKGRRKVVAFEKIDTKGGIFFIGLTPVWVSKPQTRDGDTPSASYGSTSISYFRLTFKPEKFVSNIMCEYNKILSENVLGCRYFVRRMSGDRNKRYNSGGRNYENKDEIMDVVSSRPVDCKLSDIVTFKNDATEVFFSDVHTMIMEDAKWWFDNEEWYKTRGIPWRRGYLLHGPTGSGKTSMVRMLAKRLDLPIFSFDLPSFGNEDFAGRWKDMTTNTPCIALIEDFDGVFNGRKNLTDMTDNIGLTFDCLLNMIDGAEEFDGLILVVTTNKMENLDPALATKDGASRPGRVDKVVEIGPLTLDGAAQICKKMLPDHPDEEVHHIASRAKSGDITAAVMVEMCRAICMAKAKGINVDIEKAKEEAKKFIVEFEETKQRVAKQNLKDKEKGGPDCPSFDPDWD